MSKPSQLACVCAALCMLHAGGGQAASRGVHGQAGPALEDYSLEQLSDIVVTSISRQPGRLASAPAPVYAIGGADIVRSGATTLSEALRPAPNLLLAFTGAQDYAIGARGFSLQPANKLPWSGGYRHARDRFENGPILQFSPARRRLRWGKLFAQDAFAVTEALRATAGLRLEHNDYTGIEVLPSLRLAWQAPPDIEPALTGRNLLHARHLEFGTAGMRQLAERAVFASAALRF